MKKLLYVAIGVLLLASCSQEENSVNQAPLTSDLSVMLPERGLDTSESGMYAGMIVADHTNFHGKIWINIANDTQYHAMIKTIDDEILGFELVSINESIYAFQGERGSFNLDLTDFRSAEMSNIVIDNTPGHSRVMKESNGNKALIVLGTFDAAYLGTLTGTWDFMVDPATDEMTEIMAVSTSGVMRNETSETFDLGDPGCYTGGPFPPFFFEDLDPAVNNYEMYAVNQTWDLPSGRTLIYDLAFSKNIADANALDYNRMLGFPEITNPFFFDPPLDPGCYNIEGSNGLYIMFNAAGEALHAGDINFDTSGLIPVTPLTSDGTSTYETVTPVFQGM